MGELKAWAKAWGPIGQWTEALARGRVSPAANVMPAVLPPARNSLEGYKTKLKNWRME